MQNECGQMGERLTFVPLIGHWGKENYERGIQSDLGTPSLTLLYYERIS